MSSFGSSRRASVAVGVAFAIAIFGVVSAALGLSLGSGDSSYQLKAHFTTANGIIDGSDVFIGGVKVGVVYNPQVDDGGGMTMTLKIDPHYGPIHQGATVAVRPKSLLGEKYVALTVGDPGRPTYNSGDELPAEATSVNVELDQLINVFDEPTRQQLRTLIDQLGTGLAGQGRSTNETFQAGAQDLSSLAQVTDVLQQRDAELKRIIQALTKLTETLATDQQRQNYPQLLAHSQTVLTALKQEDADVQQGLERMNSFFGEIDAGFAGRSGDLQGILTDLPTTLSDLDALSQNLSAKGQRAYPLVLKGLPGLVGGDLVFGSQPDKTAFTRDIFTRVQPSQGCFTVNGRTTDASGNAQDSGAAITTICTSGGNLNLPLGMITTALCQIAPPGTLPTCGTAGAASTSPKPTTGGTTTPALPGVSPPSITPPAVPTPDAQGAQRDILKYLLQ